MVQVAQSGLMKKYGAKLDQAVKAVADKPLVERGFRNAPAGIKDGYIQIQDCFFEQQDKDTKVKLADGKPAIGEYVFRVVGVITDNFENDDNESTKGIPVRINRGYGICCFDVMMGERLVTQQEQIDEIMNYFKLWGIDTAGAGGAELEPFAAAITESKPCIKFTTNRSKTANKKGEFTVYENWGKIDPDYVPPDPSSAVQDNTGNPTKSQNSTTKSGGTTQNGSQSKTSETDEVPFGDDLDDLAVDCGSDDNDTAATATAKMAEYAKAVGVDHESDQYEDWAAVAEAIRQARASGSEEDVAALGVEADNGDDTAIARLTELAEPLNLSEDEFNSMSWSDVAARLLESAPSSNGQVVVGHVYGYEIFDAAKKKKVKTDCEVLSLKDGKVTLKNLTTGKPVTNPKTKKPELIEAGELIHD